MRLAFNVLWVEDQPHAVRSQQDAIRRHMHEEGFELTTTHCSTLDDIRSQLASDVFTDTIDLVLVDWELGTGLHGEDAITVIRDSIRFKDVIFYSAQADRSRLREATVRAGLDGIYCAGRADLVDEVNNVFDSLVKKVLDLDHCRGIIMGATSDIDALILSCLRESHEMLEAEDRASIVAQTLDLLQDRLTKLQRKLSALGNAPTWDQLYEFHLLFSATVRARVLVRILKLPTLREHKAATTTITLYRDKVLPHRDTLGHKVLAPIGGRTHAAVQGATTLDVASVRQLRKCTLEVRQDLSRLLVALRARGTAGSPS